MANGVVREGSQGRGLGERWIGKKVGESKKWQTKGCMRGRGGGGKIGG